MWRRAWRVSLSAVPSPASCARQQTSIGMPIAAGEEQEHSRAAGQRTTLRPLDGIVFELLLIRNYSVRFQAPASELPT